MGVVELNCGFGRVMRGERDLGFGRERIGRGVGRGGRNLGFLNLGFLNELIERSLNEVRGTQMRF